MVNTWKLGQTGAAFTQDPRVSLLNFLKTNWSAATSSPAVGSILFTPKLTDQQKSYIVVVEKMPAQNQDSNRTVGGSRKRVYDIYRLYVIAKGMTSVNDAFNMVQAIDSLVDANPLGLQSNGIDEMKVIDYDLLPDSVNQLAATNQATGLKVVTYVVRVQLTFDKYY